MVIERRRSISSQVSSALSERIRTQEYASGSRLPSESELASEFGVSRATVRSALSRLASEGLVIRRQGDGTYVNAHIDHIPTRMGGMWNFIRLIENIGRVPSIHLLDKQVRPASPVEAKALDLEAGTSVLSMARRFCADGVPVILAQSAVPLELLRVPAEECNGELPLGDFVSLYYKQDINHLITYAIFDIQAEMPEAEIRRRLEFDSTEPLLRLEQTFYDKANQPVFYSLSHLRDRLVRLRLVQAWE
ncbi:MAG: GntR family transcriptional regulator [Anaerolineae bacterium]